MARSDSRLSIRFSPPDDGFDWYESWVAPYLYYFDYQVDQRFFLDKSWKKPQDVMLVPVGAKRPTVFQRNYPITDCIYVSSPRIFYSPPR
jgi:hypothetical protein